MHSDTSQHGTYIITPKKDVVGWGGEPSMTLRKGRRIHTYTYLFIECLHLCCLFIALFLSRPASHHIPSMHSCHNVSNILTHKYMFDEYRRCCSSLAARKCSCRRSLAMRVVKACFAFALRLLRLDRTCVGVRAAVNGCVSPRFGSASALRSDLGFWRRLMCAAFLCGESLIPHLSSGRSGF